MIQPQVVVLVMILSVRIHTDMLRRGGGGGVGCPTSSVQPLLNLLGRTRCGSGSGGSGGALVVWGIRKVWNGQ